MPALELSVDEQTRSDQLSWVARLREGSADRDAAIAELRAFLLRGLSRSLTHRYGGQIDPEDVAQQALLRILESLEAFRGESRFTTWATSIAVRIGISQLRRRYYRDISLEAGPDGEQIQIPSPVSKAAADPDEEGRGRLIGLLQQLIDETLTGRQRLAIRGTLEGLPIEEIAVRLQSNRNAVYKLVHDARMRLRKGLESQGVTVDEIVVMIT